MSSRVIDRSSIADHAKMIINKSLQARLLVDQQIKFINYTVDVNGTVYYLVLHKTRGIRESYSCSSSNKLCREYRQLCDN